MKNEGKRGCPNIRPNWILPQGRGGHIKKTFMSLEWGDEEWNAKYEWLSIIWVDLNVNYEWTGNGELRTQKLKSHLVRTQSLNVLRLKPGVGQYITIHATLTARDFFLAYFYTSCPFCFFYRGNTEGTNSSKILCLYLCMFSVTLCQDWFFHLG